MSSSAQRDDMTDVGKDESPKREYEVPALIELGSIAELTQGTPEGTSSDGQSGYS